MEEVLRKLLGELKEQFGIQGEVYFSEERGDFPLVSSGQQKQYFIVLPQEQESFREFKINLYHEFGHIALAERVHSTFVDFGISAPRWWRPRFEAMLQGAGDVLVNSLLWEIEPKIAIQEIFSSLELVMEPSRKIESSEEMVDRAFKAFNLAEGAFLVIHTLLTEACVERAPLTPEIQTAKELITESFSYLFPKWAFSYREALIELPRKDFTIRRYLQPLRAYWREAFEYSVSLRNRTFYFEKIS